MWLGPFDASLLSLTILPPLLQLRGLWCARSAKCFEVCVTRHQSMFCALALAANACAVLCLSLTACRCQNRGRHTLKDKHKHHTAWRRKNVGWTVRGSVAQGERQQGRGSLEMRGGSSASDMNNLSNGTSEVSPLSQAEEQKEWEAVDEVKRTFSSKWAWWQNKATEREHEPSNMSASLM